MKTLNTQKNCFNELRLFAASLVIYSHSFPLLGLRPEPISGTVPFLTLGTLAVAIFFAISGYLLVKSLQFNPCPIRFVKNRILRIYPGLLVCVMVCSIIIGPLVTEVPLPVYFTSKEFYKFLANSFGFVMPSLTLPGTFSKLAIPSMNGSLWTLPIEISVYGMLLCLHLAFLKFSKEGQIGRSFVLLGGLATAILVAFPHSQLKDSYFMGMPKYWICFYSVIFFTGGIWALYETQFKRIKSLFIGLFVVGCFFYSHPIFLYIFIWCLSALIIELGVKFSGRINHRQDISYGVYLYGFPIQQIYISYGKIQNPYGLALLSLATAYVVGYLSSKWIEQPALKLKERSLTIFQRAV